MKTLLNSLLGLMGIVANVCQAQTLVRIQPENPAIQSQMQGYRVEVNAPNFPPSRPAIVKLNAETTRTIDSAGTVIFKFDISKTGLRFVNFFRDSTSLVAQHLLLHPNDTLLCVERKGKLQFVNNSKTAKINRFLFKNGLLGEDSLLRRPLMRKVSEEMYGSFMRDMAEQKWLEYQTTQDTTNATQNAFVEAALEGQQFLRTQFFVTTKDWTDDMFDKIQIRGRIYFENRENIAFKPSLRIVPHEDAILALDYQNALFQHLGREAMLIGGRKKLSENLLQFYDNADRLLSQLPQTRETLVGATLTYGGLGNDDISTQLVARYERDFPKSSFLSQIKRNHWATQKAQKGIQVPPIPLLLQDSTTANLHSLQGQKTILLIWNTWEDSCQVALAEVAQWAAKNKSSNLKYATICAKNRFDSWKEVLQKHWPNAPKTNHLYADYDIEQIVSGVFSAKRPLLVLLDAEGKFVASSSPFDAEKIKAWLK